MLLYSAISHNRLTGKEKVMQRLKQLKLWLKDEVGLADFSIEPASSDASFRRYFRVCPTDDGKAGQFERSMIVMDAPPENEDTGPFIEIARLFRSFGLNVPEVKHIDAGQGFLLLSDLGSVQYLSKLDATTVDALYGDALDALLKLQVSGQTQIDALPAYDHALLMREMELFREWYLQRHLDISLTSQQHALLDETFELLAQQALAQPTVIVHRDYHSRNLMITEENNPGVLDFQDAVAGPITYDLVSLLRDCYIAWPREQVESRALSYLHKAQAKGLFDAVDDQCLLRWFDWMGVQRHLKATGIFARLNHRDGKPGYLEDIPRTLGYVRDVSGRYDALSAFHRFLSDVVPEQ